MPPEEAAPAIGSAFEPKAEVCPAAGRAVPETELRIGRLLDELPDVRGGFLDHRSHLDADGDRAEFAEIDLFDVLERGVLELVVGSLIGAAPAALPASRRVSISTYLGLSGWPSSSKSFLAASRAAPRSVKAPSALTAPTALIALALSSSEPICWRRRVSQLFRRRSL